MILGDAGLAEDAVQGAFVRLLKRGRMDDVVSAWAFLRVVVRHEAYGLLARRRPAELMQDAEAQLLVPLDQAVERGEEQRQLEQALRQLPSDQREVIQLKVWERLTFAQIAEVLAIPANTAASRYRYAIARLREILPAARS
jgi:RNA polymerase sigma-70 factor (ECF subfamily)